MDHFLSTVSHELRSPINVISNWSELLECTSLRDNLPRAAGIIRRNAKQLAMMIDDLLDSGAIVTGRLSIQRTRVAFHDLVKDLVDDLVPQASHKGLRLVSSTFPPCNIVGDAARLRQVMWNLINNAIKYTDAGAINVSLQRSNNHAILTVHDTGQGIAIAHRSGELGGKSLARPSCSLIARSSASMVTNDSIRYR